MKYRLTVLTPLLIGDGRKLSPIDYMVWKDHVNVLDQHRIFKLLAKGPRLDGYLNQLKRADKLDFASWGGFAQNFAGRRIPFEHSSLTEQWNRSDGPSLHIPTFAAGPSGPYLPGTAIKGALRTGLLFDQLPDGSLAGVLQRLQGDRPPRRPAETVEDQSLGAKGKSGIRALRAADSAPVDPAASFKVYLVKTSTFEQKGQQLALGWKAAVTFAEMATPGVAFTGTWNETSEAVRANMFAAANRFAIQILSSQKRYAAATGMERVLASLEELEKKAVSLEGGVACLVSVGWGGGLLAKSPWAQKDAEEYRKVLAALPMYARAVKSGLPFPKTRRVVLMGGQPAALPGWALIEVA